MGSKYLTKKTFSWTSVTWRHFVVYFWYLYLIKKEKGPLLHQWGLFFIHQGRDGPQGPISPLHTPSKTDLTSPQHKCFISERYTMIGLHNEEVSKICSHLLLSAAHGRSGGDRVSNSQKQGQATDAVHTYLWSDHSGQSGLRWGRVTDQQQWVQPYWACNQRHTVHCIITQLMFIKPHYTYQTTLYFNTM